MPVFLTPGNTYFPDPQRAGPDGLLALGGDLKTERLLEAYRRGIFPWPEGNLLCWFCPDPRFVLFPDEFRLNASAKAAWKNHRFEFTVNRDFATVIRHCKTIRRPGQSGTWITGAVEKAYTRLHQLGIAQSVEVWEDGELAGGLYGIRRGRVFYGESMFSLRPHASRCGFTFWVEQLRREGVQLIDCQVHTAYLESFGARFIPRARFVELIEQWGDEPPPSVS